MKLYCYLYGNRYLLYCFTLIHVLIILHCTWQESILADRLLYDFTFTRQEYIFFDRLLLENVRNMELSEFFSLFYSILPGECRGSTLKLGYTYPPFIGRYIE
jgi:hypothetical protein